MTTTLFDLLACAFLALLIGGVVLIVRRDGRRRTPPALTIHEVVLLAVIEAGHAHCANHPDSWATVIVRVDGVDVALCRPCMVLAGARARAAVEAPA